MRDSRFELRRVFVSAVFFFYNRHPKKMVRLTWGDVPIAWREALKLNWHLEQPLEMEESLWHSMQHRLPQEDERVTLWHPYLESRVAVELLLDRCTLVSRVHTRSRSHATEHKDTINNELKEAGASGAPLLTPQEDAVRRREAIDPRKTPFNATETKLSFLCKESDKVR